MSLAVLSETTEKRIAFDNLKTQIVSLFREKDYEEYFSPDIINKK